MKMSDILEDFLCEYYKHLLPFSSCLAKYLAIVKKYVTKYLYISTLLFFTFTLPHNQSTQNMLVNVIIYMRVNG